MEVYVNVKNFGKIKDARVNISNFTVFVGNNNSGKTQLMELIYTVIKHLARCNPDIDLPQIDRIDAFRIGESEIKKLNVWANEYLTVRIHEIIDEAFNASIPIEEIRLEFEQIDSGYEVYFLTDRTIDYAVKKDLLPREMLAEEISKRQYYRSFIIKYDMAGKGEGSTRTEFSRSIPVELAKEIETGNILGEILGGKSPVSSNVLFLPASRMGLMLLYKHYFGNTDQNKDETIRNKYLNSKGITKPVLDFLSFLLKYSYTEKIAKRNEEIIDFISAHLIDGKIDERGDLTVYTPKDQKKEIPIYVASSMVNEVVPLIKALTDSDEVDFIFYDEVETSMHPLKQTEMVKLFNRLSNKGIKLLISTHSDTMATKINNLLLMSYGNFDDIQDMLGQKGIQVEESDLLHSRDIHVYQFLNEPDGKSIVKELEFKQIPFTGFDFSLFNDNVTNLFEEAKAAMGLEDED